MNANVTYKWETIITISVICGTRLYQLSLPGNYYFPRELRAQATQNTAAW